MVKGILTGKDNATIGFFIKIMMDSKKDERINYNQETFKNFLTITLEDKQKYL
jgi:hypothetical protein